MDKAGFKRMAATDDKKEKTRLMVKPYRTSFVDGAA